jgi:hypothetical protein
MVVPDRRDHTRRPQAQGRAQRRRKQLHDCCGDPRGRTSAERGQHVHGGHSRADRRPDRDLRRQWRLRRVHDKSGGRGAIGGRRRGSRDDVRVRVGSGGEDRRVCTGGFSAGNRLGIAFRWSRRGRDERDDHWRRSASLSRPTTASPPWLRLPWRAQSTSP